MARTLKPSIVFRSPDYRNHPDYGAHDYNNQTPRLQVPCFVFGACCQTHTKIKNQANIMAKPCHHHAKIMPISCQHHANIMPNSLQNRANIEANSCHHHANTFHKHATTTKTKPKSCHTHAKISHNHVTLVPKSCHIHATNMAKSYQYNANIIRKSYQNRFSSCLLQR